MKRPKDPAKARRFLVDSLFALGIVGGFEALVGLWLFAGIALAGIAFGLVVLLVTQ